VREVRQIDIWSEQMLTITTGRYGSMKIKYRYAIGKIVLGFVMLPLWSVAGTLPDQQLVDLSGQASAGPEQVMPAWVEPPVGPYRFFPPQPDVGQAEMMPDPSAGYPDYRNTPYPRTEYPSAGNPPATRQPLPVPNNGYAYEYQNQYQPPSAGMYGYDRAMQPPAGVYNYGNYPRGNYPTDMRPDYYPYGSTGQMPVQPYYR